MLWKFEIIWTRIGQIIRLQNYINFFKNILYMLQSKVIRILRFPCQKKKIRGQQKKSEIREKNFQIQIKI